MKILSISGVVAAAVFLVQCTQVSNDMMPDGVYREPSGVEVVTVQRQNMILKLNVTKGAQLGVQTGQYPYLLLGGRQVALSGSSNDAFYLFAVVNFEWIWDGKNLLRKHKQSGDTVVFSRQG